jgi:hypothetical protein
MALHTASNANACSMCVLQSVSVQADAAAVTRLVQLQGVITAPSVVE